LGGERTGRMIKRLTARAG